MKKLALLFLLLSTQVFAADYVCKKGKHSFQLKINASTLQMIDPEAGETTFEFKEGTVKNDKTSFTQTGIGYSAMNMTLTVPTSVLGNEDTERFSVSILGELTSEGAVIQSQTAKLTCTKQ